MIVDLTNDCSDNDDKAPNNVLEYSIESVNGINNDGIFQIGTSNGQLKFASQPNFSQSEHVIVITVSENDLKRV